MAFENVKKIPLINSINYKSIKEIINKTSNEKFAVMILEMIYQKH